MYEVELYHHGIRGQKWGVRQFQNYDGTLTAKGKLHTAGQYKSALNKIDKSLAKERRAYSDEKRSASKFKNKSDKLVEKSKTSDDEMLTIKLKKQVDKYDAKAADHDAKAEKTHMIIVYTKVLLLLINHNGANTLYTNVSMNS